ncbi:MAG: glycosyltransferase family 4 protein [Thermodesulfobacteriota bacterium]|nr:glycosyltransferase family 4 protein [Thermodesulfobacteriota bacterium]
MSIWIINHAGGTPYHGPNMRSYYLAREFVRRGNRTAIVSASFFHKYINPPKVQAGNGHEVIDGVDYFWTGVPRYNGRGGGQVLNQLVFTARAFGHVVQLPMARPRVVIASSPHPFVSLPAWRVAQRFSCPFVFEIRDLWPLAIRELTGWPSWHPYIAMLSWAERFGCTKADHIVSVKPGDIQYLSQRFGTTTEGFSWIPNGHPCEDSPPSFKTYITWPKGDFTLGYVGALSKYYALETLLKAVGVLQSGNLNIQLVIVGDGALRSSLEKIVQQMRLKNVFFAGAVPKQAVPEILRHFDVCYLGLAAVSINRFGVSCNKLYDYMYASVPVIMSAAVPREFDPVAEAACGISVPAEEPEAVAHAVQQFRDMPRSYRIQLGKNGRKYLERRHSFKHIADTYLECIASLRKQ